MRLQIDTTNRTIKVEESVNLKALIDTLEEMFPKGLWKKFTLETNCTIVWSYPAIVYPSVPSWPWWTPTYTTGHAPVPVDGNVTICDSNKDTFLVTNGAEYELANGIYNIEIKN